MSIQLEKLLLLPLVCTFLFSDPVGARNAPRGIVQAIPRLDAGAAGDTPATPLTIGIVYVGDKDDFGFNAAHADGAKALIRELGAHVIEASRIPETRQCELTMESMIKDGASIIFATSYGYLNPFVKRLAVKYPKVTFLHCGGMLRDDDPPNIGTYYANFDELEYLCGMAAGAATHSGKLGYVAAKPIAPVLRDINAFELGAKSVNPNCTLSVIFTGDWYLPAEESNAVNNLADQGVDVVSGHIDSLKVLIETAEKRAIYSCGHHYDGSSLAPKGYLTGAEWNWGPMYVRFAQDFEAGKPMPRNYLGSLKDNAVKLSPYGSAINKETRTRIEKTKGDMAAGKFRMFKGPLKDNRGEIVIPDGTAFDDQDPELWGMNYLIEGVIGNVQ